MELDRLRPVAQVYWLATLDCLIELALAVADDQARRPERYGQLGDDAMRALAALRDGQGDVCRSLDERTLLYEAMSGRPEALLPPLSVAEWAFRDAGLAMIDADSERRRSYLGPFIERTTTLRSFLELVGGAAEQSLVRLKATFEPALTALRAPAVARAFGLTSGPVPPWPFDEALSPVGAQLVEVVSGDLQVQATGPISQYEFLVLQRLAFHRGNTIQAVVEGRFDQEVGDLGPLVAWQHALDDFRLANVARAWRGDVGSLIARERARAIPDIPVERAGLSPRVLEFISSCAGDGT
jgi:hypothetical protein